ncbi:MAG: hypothetical protein ACI8UO_006607 [Verrucomicrobiales bacterium]|jgi:hypothetical protein
MRIAATLLILAATLVGTARTSCAEKFDFDTLKDRLPWIWEKPQRSLPPALDPDSEIDPVDAWVLANLEIEKLAPAPAARDRLWLRRAHFAITGLPPSIAEMASFDGDTSPDRKRRATRSLLASPHFGERWARHWMDLVRYAESRGHETDFTIANAYHYRDYLIRAFNADLPYDDFVTEHIAGDLLEKPRVDPTTGINESVLATGWPFFGEEVHSPVDIRQDECDRLDNKVDVLSKTFLGLTVSCARCHDHKFDAIRQSDYYALAGFVLSSSYRQVRFESMANNRTVAQKLDALRAEFRPKLAAAVAAAAREKMAALESAEIPSDLQIVVRGSKIADFTDQDSSPWLADGPTFGSTAILRGELSISSDPDAVPIQIATYGGAKRDPFWNGLKVIDSENDSGSLDGVPRAGKMIRTPTVTLESGEIHYLIRGKAKVYAAVSQHIMVTGPLHGTLVREFKVENADQPQWVTHNLKRYAGLRAHFEFGAVGNEPFEILMVVEGPKPEISRSPSRKIDRQGLLAALDDLADGNPDAKNVETIRWILANSGLKASDLASDYLKRLEQLHEEVKWESHTAVAWLGGNGVNENVLDRGSPKSPGDPAPRQLPDAFGTGLINTASSGRLQLAQQIASAENPLTARVIVNRVWHQLFGRGLVATTDNFGWLGERPTHPQLLDYLAIEFVETHHWSIKSLVERLVLTRTFAMSSTAAIADFDARAPDNRLLHRMPIRRLEAEVIRDSALAISGRLDRKMGGKPVPVFLSEFVVGRGRPAQSGPLDGAGRRSIYTSVRRNFLPTLMLAFDFPTPFSSVGKRDVTNVAAQSLALMNDPFLYEQAGVWADRIQRQMPDQSAPIRVRRMFEEAFARPPSDAELAACIESLTEFGNLYNGDPNSHDAWRDLCHSFFSMNEFIYVK